LLHIRQATIVLAAVAIGTYFGLEHKRKGMDVLGNLLFTPNTDTPQMTPARYGTVRRHMSSPF
jgi:hypothetical protein